MRLREGLLEGAMFRVYVKRGACWASVYAGPRAACEAFKRACPRGGRGMMVRQDGWQNTSGRK